MPDPWLIHFFQRHQAEDPAEAVPAIDFLDSLPLKTRAEIIAVLEAVAQAPPPAFSGGGKWEAMHGTMGGYYEIRVTGPWQRDRFRPFAVCLTFRRERTHPPRPVLVIAVAHDERERRAERAPVA